jgi:protein phosphatase
LAIALKTRIFSKTLFRWGIASHVGKVRKVNEDAHFLEPRAGIFLVSDGMGGHRGGKIAAQMVAQDLPSTIMVDLPDLVQRTPRTVRRFLKKWIAGQSQRIRLEGRGENGVRGMGATLVLALFLKDRAYLANLGDSRAYRLRNGRLCRFSRDHSVVAELVEQGRISPDDAEDHEEQGVITRYAGMDEQAQPHVRSFALEKGDRILLCTDGLTDMVDEKTMALVLSRIPDCQRCCNRLIELANQEGGYDNTTALVVEWAS